MSGGVTSWADTFSGVVDGVKSVGEAVGTMKSYLSGSKEEPTRYMGRGNMPGFGSDPTYNSGGSGPAFQSYHGNSFQPQKKPWETKRTEWDWDGKKKSSKKKKSKKKARDLDDFFDSSSDSEDERKRKKKRKKKKSKKNEYYLDSDDSETSEPKLRKKKSSKKKKKQEDSDDESEEKKPKRRPKKKSRKKVEKDSDDESDKRKNRRKPKKMPKKKRPTRRDSSDSEEPESETSDLDDLLVDTAPKKSKKKSKKIPAKPSKPSKRAKLIKKKLDVEDSDSDIDELFDDNDSKKSKKKKLKKKSKKASNSPVIKEQPEDVPDLLDLKALSKKSDPASILDDLGEPTQPPPTMDIFSITKTNDNLLRQPMNGGLATISQPMILPNGSQPQSNNLFTQLNTQQAKFQSNQMRPTYPAMGGTYPQAMGLQTQGFYHRPQMQMPVQQRPQMQAMQPNRSPFPAFNQSPQSKPKKKMTRHLGFKEVMSAENFTLGADPNPPPSLSSLI